MFCKSKTNYNNWEKITYEQNFIAFVLDLNTIGLLL